MKFILPQAFALLDDIQLRNKASRKRSSKDDIKAKESKRPRLEEKSTPKDATETACQQAGEKQSQQVGIVSLKLTSLLIRSYDLVSGISVVSVFL